MKVIDAYSAGIGPVSFGASWSRGSNGVINWKTASQNVELSQRDILPLPCVDYIPLNYTLKVWSR